MNQRKLIKLLRQQNLYLIEQDQRATVSQAWRIQRVRANVRLIRQLLKGQVSTESHEAYRNLSTFGPYQVCK